MQDNRIGEHIATLNLFREADGTFEITTMSATPDTIAETPDRLKPIDHIENIIVAAAGRMKKRNQERGTFRDIPNG